MEVCYRAGTRGLDRSVHAFALKARTRFATRASSAQRAPPVALMYPYRINLGWYTASLICHSIGCVGCMVCP